jgi:hypothetical protein
MTSYQQPMRLYQNPTPSMPVVDASAARFAVRPTRAKMSKLVRLLVAVVLQAAVLLLVVEMTFGFGYQGQPGPMPAPAPSPMR